MDAACASLHGLRDATSRFKRASVDLVQSAAGVGASDPATAIVDQIEAALQFKASARTMRAADEMTQTLLDIIA